MAPKAAPARAPTRSPARAPARRPRMARADAAARERLLAEAAELLRRQGAEGTTMRALAAHLGIGAASLYYHFPDRDALLAECLERELDGLVAAVEAAAAAPGRAPAQVAAILAAHIAFQLRWAGMAGRRHGRAGLAPLLRSLPPARRRRLDQRQRAIVQALRGVLVAGAADGSLRVPDPTPPAFALLSLGEHAIAWARPRGRLGPEALTALLVELGLRMVSPSPPAGEGGGEAAG